MTSPPRWLFGATSDSAFRAPTVDGVRPVGQPVSGARGVRDPGESAAADASPGVIAIDGESCGDHAFSSLERDPYTDDGGES